MPCRVDIAGIGQMETEDATQRDRVSDAKNIRQCKEMLSMGGHDTLGTTWLAGKTRLYVILRPGHQFSLCPLLSNTSFKIRSELLPLSSLHLFDIKQLIFQWFVNIILEFHTERDFQWYQSRTLSMPRWTLPKGTRGWGRDGVPWSKGESWACRRSNPKMPYEVIGRQEVIKEYLFFFKNFCACITLKDKNTTIIVIVISCKNCTVSGKFLELIFHRIQRFILD